MKFITIAIILAGAAFAQTPTVTVAVPQTIKIRVGFDKKHKPVYASANVQTGFLQTASVDQYNLGYQWIQHTVKEVTTTPLLSVTLCAPDAIYSAVAMQPAGNPKAKWEMADDVHFAIIGPKLYLIPADALAAGVFDDAPLNIVGAPGPMSNYEMLRESTRKLKAYRQETETPKLVH